jgi:hypothetical protein
MKNITALRKLVIVVVCAILSFNIFSACDDNMDASHYYTFTGETMSDYLSNREAFSMFRRIVERAGHMEYLGARGSHTFFPPVNEGVQKYLDDHGYASVEDIPIEYCDTIVKVHLIENMVHYTSVFGVETQYTNALDLPLIVKSTGDTVDASGLALSIINNSSAVINILKNDTVENGVVHPVTNVIVPNTSFGKELLTENSDGCKIYYTALLRCGLLDSMQTYIDPVYEAVKDNFPPFIKNIISGGDFNAGGNKYTAKRPDFRKMGYTVFVVPDEVLYAKYGQYFSPDKTIDENVDALYELACEKYKDDMSKQIFGIDEEKERLYWNKDSYESRHNPLNIFMSYHVLDRLFNSRDIMINCWGHISNFINPTEWVSTMLEHSMIKLEKVYRREEERDVDFHGEIYLNHSTASKYNGYSKISGAHVTAPTGVKDYMSINCAFFYIDDVLAYDEVMRNRVMNTRIRTDMYTVFPELTTNNMRMHGNYRLAHGYTAEDNTETGKNGFNYYMPQGYLKNVDFNGDAVFFVMRPKLGFWNLGGDEINFLGSTYDVRFRLPAVPPGTYEVRIGYTGMADRGIAQLYLDDVPQGIPVDLRFAADDPRVGGIYGVDLTDEELAENNRTMKNNGFYRAGRGIYMEYFSLAEKNPYPTYSSSVGRTADKIAPIHRRKVGDVNVMPGQHHTIRFRSVYTLGNAGCFMLDYLEMVPIEISGAGGLGEDIY